MLIAPIIVTGILFIIAKESNWYDDTLKTSVITCWTTYACAFACDVIGRALGWWA